MGGGGEGTNSGQNGVRYCMNSPINVLIYNAKFPDAQRISEKYQKDLQPHFFFFVMKIVVIRES